MNGSFKVKIKVRSKKEYPIEKSKPKDDKTWKNQQRQQQKRNWVVFE